MCLTFSIALRLFYFYNFKVICAYGESKQYRSIKLVRQAGVAWKYCNSNKTWTLIQYSEELWYDRKYLSGFILELILNWDIYHQWWPQASDFLLEVYKVLKGCWGDVQASKSLTGHSQQRYRAHCPPDTAGLQLTSSLITDYAG